MKRLLILFTLLFIITGCSSNQRHEETNKTINEYVTNFNKNNKDEQIIYNKIKCSALKNAKAMSHSFFVTDKNEVYKWSMENKIENDLNCSPVKFEAVNQLIGVNNTIIFDDKLNEFLYSNTDNSFSITMNLFTPELLNYKFYDSNGNVVYVLNNQLYLIDQDYTDKTVQMSKSKKITTNFAKDEYLMNISNSVIKTNKAYYNLISKNDSYQLVKNKLLTKYYDEIIAYGGNDTVIVVIDYNYYAYNFNINTNY